MNQVHLSDLKLIVGLGNIGDRYRNTRHNAGFLYLDFLRKQYEPEAKWKSEPKFAAEVCELNLQGNTLLLAKPQTMMNLSGQSVAKLVNFYKLSLTEVMIAYDDLDLNLGDFRVQFDKAPKQHNGLNSVKQYLGGTLAFWNLRIGVEAREVVGNRSIPGQDYALSNFTPIEAKILHECFEKAGQTLHVQNSK